MRRSISSSPARTTLAVARRRAAQDGADACEQLLVRERAAEVVVRPALERANAVDDVRVYAAEQDHGHVPIPEPAGLALAQPATELELGADDEVGPQALGQIEHLGDLAGAEHLEAVVGQLPFQVAARAGLGLGDDHG